MILTVISGIYAVIIGILGLLMMLLVTKQVPELETEPEAIAFHITAKRVMGIHSLLIGIFYSLIFLGSLSLYFSNGISNLCILNDKKTVFSVQELSKRQKKKKFERRLCFLFTKN